MLPSKDLQRLFKAAAWSSRAELEAFVAEAVPVPPADLLKLLDIVIVRGPADPQTVQNRAVAFGMLGDRSPSEELFIPLLRALKIAEPSVRGVLAPLVVRDNSIPGHGELCAAMRTTDVDLRRHVAHILKQVAGRTAFDMLIAMVGEPDFPGRLETADVLVTKGAHHAIPGLALMLQVGRSIDKAQALKYLGDARLMARDIPSALRAIAAALSDADERVAIQAVSSFSSLCSEDEFFQHVTPALEAHSVAIVRAAIDGLKRFGSPRAIAALERKFRQGPNSLRMAVLDALEAIGHDGVIPAVVHAMQHKQVGVRNRASEVLVALATTHKVELARTILWLLRSRDVNVRRAAAEVLQKVGDPSGELAPKLLTYLRDEDWWVRERVTDALVEMAGNQLTRYIVSYLADPSDIVRRYAVDVLFRVKDPAALGALVRTATSDADWWVRERAIEAIAALKDARALPYLIDLLGRDRGLVYAILEALASLEARSAQPHVLALLADEEPDVRLAAVRCLEALDDPSASEALGPLAEDIDHRVRRAARDVLDRWKVRWRGGPEVIADRRLPLLDRLLVGVARAEADDLLLYSNARPMVKRLGSMAQLANNVFTSEQVEAMLLPHLTPAQLSALDEQRDVDLSYEVKSEGLRFRANVFRQISGLSAVFRIIKGTLMDIEKLGLPPIVQTFGDLKNGLVLVGGPTGSGKSTTLAGVIDYVNRTYQRHIITLEDPIEVVHVRKRCLVNQREVGAHTNGFGPALRATLRQDPDVILVGEMRDLATISFAVTAAETGHLVFGTVHTVSADSSIDRIINAFPPGQHPQVRSMLAETLRAVVCQQLVRRCDGPGRALAVEVMLNNDAVSNLIRKGKTYQLAQVIQTSRDLGMQSMDFEIMRLLKEGTISEDEAYLKVTDKAAFERSLAEAEAPAGGARGPSMHPSALPPAASTAPRPTPGALSMPPPATTGRPSRLPGA